MLNAITGVRVTITAIEGIAKLSQNRTEADRAGVLAGFAHSDDPAAQQLAAEMTKKA
jgi:transcriptional regulator